MNTPWRVTGSTPPWTAVATVDDPLSSTVAVVFAIVDEIVLKVPPEATTDIPSPLVSEPVIEKASLEPAKTTAVPAPDDASVNPLAAVLDAEPAVEVFATQPRDFCESCTPDPVSA